MIVLDVRRGCSVVLVRLVWVGVGGVGLTGLRSWGGVFGLVRGV